jgi:hypothetical protein
MSNCLTCAAEPLADHHPRLLSLLVETLRHLTELPGLVKPAEEEQMRSFSIAEETGIVLIPGAERSECAILNRGEDARPGGD